MAKNEVLAVLEEADLMLTAALAAEWPHQRMLVEWRKFVANVERRYEPEKFVRDFSGPCVYEVREVKDIEDTSPNNGKQNESRSVSRVTRGT